MEGQIRCIQNISDELLSLNKTSKKINVLKRLDVPPIVHIVRYFKQEFYEIYDTLPLEAVSKYQIRYFPYAIQIPRPVKWFRNNIYSNSKNINFTIYIIVLLIFMCKRWIGAHYYGISSLCQWL